MSPFLFILALVVLPAAPTQCVVGNLKENPEVYQLSNGDRCAVVIMRPKDTVCSEALIYGDMTHRHRDKDVACKSYVDQENNVEHRCICSGSCDDLFEENVILSKTESDADLCKNSVKEVVVPVVSKLVHGEFKLHIICLFCSALVTIALLFYVFP